MGATTSVRVLSFASAHALSLQEGLFGFKPFPELWVGRMASACPGKLAGRGGAGVGAAVTRPPEKWAQNLAPTARAPASRNPHTR